MDQQRTALRIGAAGFSAAFALAIPFAFIAPADAIMLVRYFGFWAMLAVLVLFLVALRPVLSGWNATRLRACLRAHWPGLLVVLAATLFLHAHVDRSFKILFDEHVLSSTAMGMHFKHQAYTQAAGHMIGDEVIASVGFVDKRPLLFPTLIALVHKAAGYAPENVFWMNSALTFLLLGLLYGFIAKTCGRGNGMLAVVLLTSLPLFAQNTNGGGYELLNLCLLVGLAWTGVRYLRSEDGRGLPLCIMTAVLLANTRYESITYVLVPAILFGLKSLRQRKIQLDWFSAFSPLLLILPLLSYVVFSSETRFIQTDRENFFALAHFPQNLAHAVTYAFEPGGDYSNSLLLSTLGPITFLVLAVHFFRRLPRYLAEDHELTVVTAVFLIVAANTFLALSCYWGAWTDPATSRFSLPLQLMLACFVPFALNREFNRSRPPAWLLGTAVAYTLTFTAAHSARLDHEPRLTSAEGYDWALGWVEENPEPGNHLYIAKSSTGIGLYREAAIPFNVANAMPERVLLTQRLGLYDKIYAIELLLHTGDRRAATRPDTQISLNDRFVLEPVAERLINHNILFRISEVVTLERATADNRTLEADMPPKPPAKGLAASELKGYLNAILPLAPVSIKNKPEAR